MAVEENEDLEWPNEWLLCAGETKTFSFISRDMDVLRNWLLLFRSF